MTKGRQRQPNGDNWGSIWSFDYSRIGLRKEITWIVNVLKLQLLFSSEEIKKKEKKKLSGPTNPTREK